jgi:hypothetical protein
MAKSLVKVTKGGCGGWYTPYHIELFNV